VERPFGEAEGRIADVERRAARGREGHLKAMHLERHELQLGVRGPMYSNEHSMVYKHVENIKEAIRLLLNLGPDRSRTTLGARGVPGVSPSTIIPPRAYPHPHHRAPRPFVRI
jgi:hypothetical protein